MTKLNLIALFIFLSLFNYAQSTVYELHFKISPLKNKPIFFGYHFGENQYVTDTIFLNSQSEATLKKEKLPKGIYFIALPNMKYVSFILNQPKKYNFTSDTLRLLRNFKSLNDKENDIFILYQIKLNDIKTELRLLEKKLIENKDSEEVINQKIIATNNEWNSYLDKLILDNEGLFATKIIKLLRTKDFTFDANIYFKDVDFSDENLLFTPVFSTVIDNYFMNLPSLTINNIDSLYKAIDFILMNALKNTTVYEELSKYLISQFDLTGDYPNPDAFRYISEKYFLTDLIPWVTEGFKAKLSRYIQKLKSVTINESFPELKLNNINDQIITIPEKNNKPSIIIFWDPSCEHCISYLKSLKQILVSYEQKVNVYCILTGNKPDEWRKVIQEEAFPWVHVYDKKLFNDFVEELFLFNTPQIFVLNKEQRIVAKDIMADKIIQWIK
ncbi:MAG: redoxin domain-containing protein [Bacteroidales bacterium]|nr:redoxin domain-containing protein [Bacteroidales bacterium]